MSEDQLVSSSQQTNRINNLYLRIYTTYGMVVALGGYVWMIRTWVESTIHGLNTGQYFAVIATNVVGENYIELILMLSALPAVAILFVRIFRWLFVEIF